LAFGEAEMTQKVFTTQFGEEFEDLRGMLRTARFYRTLLAIAIGVTLYAIAINGIVIPHQFFSPGVTGACLIWFYVFGIPSVGILYAIINVPFFLLGWREYALRYIFISLIGVAMFAVALELTRNIEFHVEDRLMAALLAGVLTGAGSGFYLRMGGSAGGLDIIATLIRKRFSIPIGTTFITVNAINLAGALAIEGLEVTLFSALFMWVNSWTLEKVQTGFSQRRAVLIVSSRPQQVAQRIMERFERGVTLVQITGGFSNKDSKAVYTVINMLELSRLKDLLFEVDENAFITVLNAAEVIGAKFVTWEDQGYRRKTSSRASPRPPASPRHLR
jgi:uncharacterized membrane-anchored protein YitT (DUF2179 family)